MSQHTQGRGQENPGSEDAREQVRRGAEQGKSRVEETLSDVADVTRSAADDLEQRGDVQLADLVRRTATQFSSFADSLQNRNADQLLGDARRLAHSNPALFLGGSVGVGFALARLFRSGSGESGSQVGGAGASSGSSREAL